MSSPASNPNPQSASWSDSPWFWFGLFALMAAFALVVVAPKFAHRQSKLQQNYEGRRDAWEYRLQQEGAALPGHSPPPGSPTPAGTPSGSP